MQKAESKSPSDLPANQDDASSQYQSMALWIVLPAVGVLCLGGVLVWWLRRGDRAVRSRLLEARKGQFVMPPADDSPAPPPEVG